MTLSIREDIAREWCQWQDMTFPESTPESAAKHLVKEAQEVLDAIQNNEGRAKTLTECVDCMGLLFYIINRLEPDRPYFDINYFAQIKLALNKQRKWDKQKNNAYYHND